MIGKVKLYNKSKEEIQKIKENITFIYFDIDEKIIEIFDDNKIYTYLYVLTNKHLGVVVYNKCERIYIFKPIAKYIKVINKCDTIFDVEIEFINVFNETKKCVFDISNITTIKLMKIGLQFNIRCISMIKDYIINYKFSKKS